MDNKSLKSDIPVRVISFLGFRVLRHSRTYCYMYQHLMYVDMLLFSRYIMSSHVCPLNKVRS